MSFHRFVALGDSTTEGLEDPYEDGSGYRGWADRLAAMLATENTGLAYANLAIRGRKVPQIRAEQLEPALALQPDLASILGGLNDILRRHVDLDAITADMDAIVHGLRRGGATVLMFTFPDPTVTITVAARRIRARVEAWNERLRAIASDREAVMIDLERDGVGHPSLWCDDRLHANANGHEQIAIAAARSLGLEVEVGDWEPDEVPARPMISRLGDDAVWLGRHMAPWVVRRIRGRSSGDGREPKRPELTPYGS